MKFALNFSTVLLALVSGSLLLSGCADSRVADNDSTDAAKQINAADFLLTSEPGDAIPVGSIKESAKDSDEVVIVGRIGGTTHPWVDGAAAFTIVDESMKACGDGVECSCPTPWDYCCVSPDTLAANTVMIKFVGDDQRAREFNPKKVFELSELQTIVVKGTVDRDDDTGKFTILAKQLYVKK